VRAFREEKFDLVASHFALYGFPLLDQIGKTPFVVHFHGPWYAESLQEGEGRVAAFAKRQIEKLVYGRADTIIVLSRAFADFIHRSFAIPREKIQVIPGCVDLERFAVELPRSDARMRLGWPLNARIMVAVRRLSHRMGLDVLIDAMPRILRSNPEALLVIAGKGQILTALQAKVAQLGLEQRVNFLGFVPDEQLPLVYRAADLNIVPTRAWEGFGLVAAEGLASGTPSMVTPVGGLPEVVAPLSPDLVFKDQSSVSIAAGINRVFAGEISLPSAVECTEYAKKHFASSQMAERTAEVYFDVVRSRRRRMFVRP
jgi:glycosyltransferase involved in cell wall biosynthesis